MVLNCYNCAMKENVLEKFLIVLFLLTFAPTPYYFIIIAGTTPLLPLIIVGEEVIVRLAILAYAVLWFVIYYFIISFLYKKTFVMSGNLKIARVLVLNMFVTVFYFSFSNIYVDAGHGTRRQNIIAVIRQSTSINLELQLCELQNSNINRIKCLFHGGDMNYDYCKNITDITYCVYQIPVIKNDRNLCFAIKQEQKQKDCIENYDFQNELKKVQ